MPVVTAAIELDAFGKGEPQTERSEAILARIAPEVQRQAAKRGALALSIEDVRACGRPCEDSLAILSRWGVLASMEIATQMERVRNYGNHSIGDWQLQRNHTEFRTATGADYVLFVLVRDLRETSGRVVLNVLGRQNTSFKQVGVACVANLFQKRMIWCHVKSDAWGDLTDPVEARKAVMELLSDL